MSEAITDSDIIQAFLAAEGLKPGQGARALEVSRQSLNNYLRDVSRPETKTVMTWFTEGRHDWVREMALEIFVRRPELERPCVCLERIGDNGPCPRHSATLVAEPVVVEEQI